MRKVLITPIAFPVPAHIDTPALPQWLQRGYNMVQFRRECCDEGVAYIKTRKAGEACG